MQRKSSLLEMAITVYHHCLPWRTVNSRQESVKSLVGICALDSPHDAGLDFQSDFGGASFEIFAMLYLSLKQLILMKCTEEMLTSCLLSLAKALSWNCFSPSKIQALERKCPSKSHKEVNLAIKSRGKFPLARPIRQK